MKTVIRPENEKCVHLAGIRHTRYGPKMFLGGDTYDLLSRNGEGVASELDFHEHHCTYNKNVDSWTIKPADESLEALAEALDDAGYPLNGVAGRLADELRDMVDMSEHSWWEDHGVRIRVTYESKQSGREMEKEGVVSSVGDGAVRFKRDDGCTVNILRGNAIFSQSSHYPYMGDVVEVEVR